MDETEEICQLLADMLELVDELVARLCTPEYLEAKLAEIKRLHSRDGVSLRESLPAASGLQPSFLHDSHN